MGKAENFAKIIINFNRSVIGKIILLKIISSTPYRTSYSRYLKVKCSNCLQSTKPFASVRSSNSANFILHQIKKELSTNLKIPIEFKEKMSQIAQLRHGLSICLEKFWRHWQSKYHIYKTNPLNELLVKCERKVDRTGKIWHCFHKHTKTLTNAYSITVRSPSSFKTEFERQ